MDQLEDDYGPYPAVYNLDQGHKMTLATRVQCSPHRYSVMRSEAPRLAEAQRGDVPFGAYTVDFGHKKALESCARDTRRFHASSFDSKVPRFQRPWSSPVTDLFFLPDRTMNHAPISISKSVEETAVRYSIHRSKYKRFPDRPLMTEAPDVTYDVDGCTLSKNKASLAAAVAKSPMTYSNMGASQSAKAVTVRQDAYHAHLGPGSYDYKDVRDMRVSSATQRPTSSMVSGVARFSNRADPSKGLGSSWRAERDTQAWSKGTTISRTELLRPQYMPKAFANGGSLGGSGTKKQQQQHQQW